ncbi:hypothetical protein [Streptomyces clavuligerus]|uniref:hypothetical protein n=1 Tax=Streptomyces clavuligerus TaxID=1901 RepID=UPI001F079047|nr:hypothetical protein [Streptomyces clavuligerus]
MQNTRTGRELLRWLHTQAVTDDDWQALTATVPAHCVDAVVELARQCAQTWQRIADDVARPKESAVERAVTSAIRSMRENLGEELTIDALAETAMFSRFHFTRVFKNMTRACPRCTPSALRLQEGRSSSSHGAEHADISNVVGYRSIGSYQHPFQGLGRFWPRSPIAASGGFAEEMQTSPTAGRAGAPACVGPGQCSSPQRADRPDVSSSGLFPTPCRGAGPVRCRPALTTGRVRAGERGPRHLVWCWRSPSRTEGRQGTQGRRPRAGTGAACPPYLASGPAEPVSRGPARAAEPGGRPAPPR